MKSPAMMMDEIIHTPNKVASGKSKMSPYFIEPEQTDKKLVSFGSRTERGMKSYEQSNQSRTNDDYALSAINKHGFKRISYQKSYGDESTARHNRTAKNQR